MRLVKALVVALLLGLCGNSASASELEHEGTNSGGFQEEGGLEEIEEIIGEDEEEEFTREDVTCGFMMMGMFFFIMVIFYFVNYPDDDIKRYSWSNISTTISIFCAILIFSAADEVILVFVISPVLGEFPKGWRQVARVAAGYVIFIAWLAVAEVMIAYFAKAFCVSSRPDGRMAWVVHDSIRGDHGVPLQDLDSRATATVLPGTREKSIAKIGQLEVFVTMEDLEKEAAQRRTKSWSMLYAHMAGFAMISAGGDLQHSDFFRDDWPNSLLAVLLNVLFLLLVFWVSARLRPRGDESDMESDDEGPVEMWNENAIESEDELFCLSISFLLVQALRFQASGVLSTKAGLEPGENFGTMAILTVYGEALLFVVATVVVVFSGRTGRLADLLRGTLSMAFAWCLLFASRWMFESWPLLVKLNCPPKSIPGRLILSLFLSSFAFAVIIILDQIEDAASNEDRRVTHKIVKNVVTGLSILVGFTWETTMDGCAEAVFSTIHENERARLVSKFMGVVVILLIVLPAWRRYVLHTVFRLLKHQRDQRAAQKLADKLQRLDPKLQEDGLLDMSDSEESAPDPELTC